MLKKILLLMILQTGALAAADKPAPPPASVAIPAEQAATLKIVDLEYQTAALQAEYKKLQYAFFVLKIKQDLKLGDDYEYNPEKQSFERKAAANGEKKP